MEDLNRKLTEILQDPGRIQQIMEMASAMGLQTSPEPITETPVSEEALRRVSQVVHQMEEKDSRQQTLVRALLPYLSPKRQARLERAMKISHMSRLAGAALQSEPMLSIFREEVSDV